MMKKQTHTPGPWDDASKYPGIDSVRIFAGTYYIATVGNSDGPREITEANASLIAAAPDLLAAAQAALNDRMYKDWPAVADLLLAAIAKAEGRPSPEAPRP